MMSVSPKYNEVPYDEQLMFIAPGCGVRFRLDMPELSRLARDAWLRGFDSGQIYRRGDAHSAWSRSHT